MTVSIFGIRHHGSGCSRALVSALEEFNPDLLLVEGPPEGTDAIKYAASPEMRPPVALIVYPEADPKRARANRRIPIKGEIPSPVNPKPGCRFADRCEYATDICRQQQPETREIRPGHFMACHNK